MSKFEEVAEEIGRDSRIAQYILQVLCNVFLEQGDDEELTMNEFVMWLCTLDNAEELLREFRRLGFRFGLE